MHLFGSGLWLNFGLSNWFRYLKFCSFNLLWLGGFAICFVSIVCRD